MKSSINLAAPGAKSLRTTIPQGVVAFLEAKNGDDLEWGKMDIIDGKRVVIVTKADGEVAHV